MTFLHLPLTRTPTLQGKRTVCGKQSKPGTFQAFLKAAEQFSDQDKVKIISQQQTLHLFHLTFIPPRVFVNLFVSKTQKKIF